MSFKEPLLVHPLVSKILRQKLFTPGETVVVAVSGGADSVALLDLLANLPDTHLKLVVAHLNHCLRGEESDGDEEFVSGLAARYGAYFVTKRVEVAELSEECGLSLEDAGRRARYAFFAETAEVHGATSIALAHHLDDQAETVLMRLLRGAGTSGLTAMSPVSGNMLKRPLLQITRAELEQYLSLRGISHRTDSTNSDTALLRNSIRHELIPLLKRYNPRISERLATTAEILAGDEELLAAMTQEAFARLSAGQAGEVALAVDALAKEAKGLRLRLYRHALARSRGDLQRISLSHLEAIDKLVLSDRPNARLKLPGDCFVVRCYGSLTFDTAAPRPKQAWRLEVEGEGSFKLPSGAIMTIQRRARPSELDPGSRQVAFLDLASAPFPWTVRAFQAGDRFSPLGMQGRQKVKDFLINQKVPPAKRQTVPIVLSGERIVWIAGLRLANDASVGSDAVEVIRVELQNP